MIPSTEKKTEAQREFTAAAVFGCSAMKRWGSQSLSFLLCGRAGVPASWGCEGERMRCAYFQQVPVASRVLSK